MHRRLGSIKRASSSNVRKGGTTLATSQHQRSSKRLILGHVYPPKTVPDPTGE
jgi:hypothetical protein